MSIWSSRQLENTFLFGKKVLGGLQSCQNGRLGSTAVTAKVRTLNPLSLELLWAETIIRRGALRYLKLLASKLAGRSRHISYSSLREPHGKREPPREIDALEYLIGNAAPRPNHHISIQTRRQKQTYICISPREPHGKREPPREINALEYAPLSSRPRRLEVRSTLPRLLCCSPLRRPGCVDIAWDKQTKTNHIEAQPYTNERQTKPKSSQDWTLFRSTPTGSN